MIGEPYWLRGAAVRRGPARQVVGHGRQARQVGVVGVLRVAPASHHEYPGRDLGRLLVGQLIVERAHRVTQLTPQAALTDGFWRDDALPRHEDEVSLRGDVLLGENTHSTPAILAKAEAGVDGAAGSEQPRV